MLSRLVSQLTVKLLLALLVSPFFALYGLWCLVGGARRLQLNARAARRLMAPSVACSACGARNSLSGRWRCSSCHAIYYGFVGRCAICGAGCRFFPCEACGAAIPLGLR